MGDAARTALLRRTTTGERFDMGIELSEAMMAAVVAAADIPPDASPEEKARLAFWALRRAGGRAGPQ